MKILLVNGSPRPRGNSSAALDAAAHLLSAQPEHTVERLSLYKMKLSGCKACNACKKNGGHCITPDDSDRVVMKIYESDIIIFGTPVYSWSISAQLKMAIDKMYSRDGMLAAQHKKIGLFVTGADALDGPQYHMIREQFQCLCHAMHWELLFYQPFCAWNPGEIASQEDFADKIAAACAEILK